MAGGNEAGCSVSYRKATMNLAPALAALCLVVSSCLASSVPYLDPVDVYADTVVDSRGNVVGPAAPAWVYFGSSDSYHRIVSAGDTARLEFTIKGDEKMLAEARDDNEQYPSDASRYTRRPRRRGRRPARLRPRARRRRDRALHPHEDRPGRQARSEEGAADQVRIPARVLAARG